MVVLLIQLTWPIYHTGTFVVLYSGFCVLKGITNLQRRGVYDGLAIKKRRYWPTYIPGDTIVLHFESKIVGNVDALQGASENTPFRVYFHKDPDCMKMVMMAYSYLTQVDYRPTSRKLKVLGVWKTNQFFYPEPFSNH